MVFFLISLSIVLSRSICVVANDKNFLLFVGESYFICSTFSLSIHPSVDTWLFPYLGYYK